ncbi:MAG: hypothetical protein EXS08_08335 [Planctomycetes bacterium]|nr:hypothetical protein [Planctomycetota bacterium]
MHRPRRLLALVVLVLLAPALAAQDDGRGWRWKELELELWIEPELESAHLEGHGRLVLEAESSSGPRLELAAALFAFVAVDAPGARVTLGKREDGALRIATARLACAQALARGAELEVHFECDNVGRSDQFAIGARAALASWVEAWYPAPYGGPEADLSLLLAAPGVTRFHLPEGWQSVSNGAPLAASEPGVEAWRVELPVARSFACAPFTSFEREVGGRRVAIHRLTSAQAGAERELGAVAAILRTLEAHFGPYPYPSYRVVELPVGVGDFLGSSEQGFILVRPLAFAAPDGNLALFAHELAHGWWGNLVGAQGPGGILLEEGLAQYSAVLALEELEGEAAATDFLRFSRPGYVDEQCARGYFDSLRAGRDQALSTLEGGDLGHYLADAKFHWVLHMLRARVGDERFFATLRALLREYAELPLTLVEFRRRFVECAPEVDVPRFFADWLDRPGAPIVECAWSAQPSGARVTLRQVQRGEPYRLELELALDSAAGRSSHTLTIAGRETIVELPSGTAPTGIEIDPRHRLLLWTPEYGPKPGP